MALTKAQKQSLRALAADLAAAPRGGKRALVESYAANLGRSVPSVYRDLAKLAAGPGARGERKKRSDAGRRCVDRDLALQMAGLVHTARRAHGKKTMTMELAAHVLAANGHGKLNPETGELLMPAASTLSRAMREYGCHPQQLKRGAAGPVTSGRVRSLHPNHSWQMDPSVCVLYYLPGGKLALMDERKYNERKPGKLAEIGNLRVLRYLVVDHCTHSIYLRYAQERGESATGALTTLIEAMSDRGPLDPMHGLPLHLYADPGSAHRASLIREFCERLGIKLQFHAAGRAQATGSVEVAQRIVEAEFEGRLRFTDVADLAGLQELADNWRRHYNAHARHSRLKCPRNAAWLRITSDQLRTAAKDTLIAISHWRHVERTVSDRMSISVDTRLPGLPPQEYDLRALAYAGLKPKDKVRVELNPFSAPDITVIKTEPSGEERRWDVSPIIKDEWGFDASAPVMGESYRAMPETDTDRALKEIRAAAAATADIKHAYPALDIMADVRAAPLHLRPAGRGLDLAPPSAAPLPLTPAQAALRLRALAPEAFGREALACMDYVRGRFPEFLPEDKLAEVAAELTRRFAPGARPARVIAFAGAERPRRAASQGEPGGAS